MTWNAFKKIVDDSLAAQGSTGDVEIRYIDVIYPHTLDADDVMLSDETLAICD